MKIIKQHAYLFCTLICLTFPFAASAMEGNNQEKPPLDVYWTKFIAQDRDNDNIYDGLTAQLNIKTACVGHYALSATLESAAGKLLSSSPIFEYTSPIQDPSLSFTAAISDTPRNIQVTFSGEDIRRAGASGVYSVKLMNMGQIICDYGTSPYKEIIIPSPPFNHLEFGENCGTPPRPCRDVYK